jgi:hypothetical protein
LKWIQDILKYILCYYRMFSELEEQFVKKYYIMDLSFSGLREFSVKSLCGNLSKSYQTVLYCKVHFIHLQNIRGYFGFILILFVSNSDNYILFDVEGVYLYKYLFGWCMFQMSEIEMRKVGQGERRMRPSLNWLIFPICNMRGLLHLCNLSHFTNEESSCLCFILKGNVRTFDCHIA